MLIALKKITINEFSPNLFWDVDESQFDMDKYASHVIQRVLEYGQLCDWRIIMSYYGLDKIVEHCRRLRTLDPRALSFICCLSHTKKETYRCYNFAQSFPTLWNS
ncbi:MAG: hypothetical protein MJZ08_00575 [Bacteroidaceae bacterium]|nr:hypothetical protein [Bacteroidaceae bacterium]